MRSILASLVVGSGPYPGPTYLHPKVHNSPDCLHEGGWHDIAASITVDGTHHVFQGCPGHGGWHHAASEDLVHWEDRGLGPMAIHETFMGMDSDITPCSGFAVEDEAGKVCAGFRQCGSKKGVHGGHSWDVPLEIRCATNEALTDWGAPEYLYDVFFFRALPYDPVRPWKGTDGKWYSTIAVDACNATAKLPCIAGSRNELWRSPELHGSGAAWEHVGNHFTSNRTVLEHGPGGGNRYHEFTTPNFFGGLIGDPRGGRTRVFTDNNAGGFTMYFIGTQTDGEPFVDEWATDGKIGAFDYSSFAPTYAPGAHGFGALKQAGGMVFGMARTLGGATNQVATPDQRHVLVAWLEGGGGRVAQSIARDLSLDADGLMLQQFVPELKALRGEHHSLGPSDAPANLGQQLEVLVECSVTGSSGEFGVSVLGGDGYAVTIGANLTSSLLYFGGSAKSMAGPLNYAAPFTGRTVTMHAYVDHSIVTVLANNRTGLTQFVTPPSATAGAVSLFGGDVASCKADVWVLKDANNLQAEVVV